MSNNENIWNLKGFHAKIEEIQRSGDIRLLHFIEKQGPRNGAEILNELQKFSDLRMQYMNHMHPRSFGCGPLNRAERHDELQNVSDSRIHHMSHMQPKRFRYSSPSYVYPALKKLEGEGLISKNKEDKYELTGKGKNSLKELQEVFKTDKRGGDDAFNIENAFTELDSNIDYLEDTGKEKLKDHLESIENLIVRLKIIKESLDQ